MANTIFLFIFLIVFWTAVSAFLNVLNKNKSPKNKEKDVTCETQYNHKHEENRNYVVREEPEEGYVTLNGVKRRIEDCKYL